MALPPLVPLPPASVRMSIAPQEWEACLDAWLTLAELNLRLPVKQFTVAAGGPLGIFLPSFYHESSSLSIGDATLSSEKARQLFQTCFMLVNRVVEEADAPSWILNWEFLSDLCHVHMRSAALSRLLNSLWKRKPHALETVFQKRKDSITKLLESSEPAQASEQLAQLAPVLRTSAQTGALFINGTDFLDAANSAYSKTSLAENRKSLVGVVYLGLGSLLHAEHANLSALSDSLYSLRAQADKEHSKPSLLADLVTNTPLITKLRHEMSGKGADRLAKLLETLETYRMPSLARTKKHPRPKSSKGKGRAIHVADEIHVHRMSLVTQVQDLFPELGSGFILRLLDEYDDDVEQVTAHLLDDSLPSHLSSLDRSAQAPVDDADMQDEITHMAPRSTPPPPESFLPLRRNVFDDDELLAADTSRLHIGKKVVRDEAVQPNKAAILSALAAFDSDDDERDDTYDVEDVGGTIDTAHPDGEPGPAARVTQEEIDMALFSTYKSTPELFGRTFDVRRSQARRGLKAETGMTDEAIEGWAIMLQRDPKRFKKLESQTSAAATFDGSQPQLAPTAYRESPAGTETDDSDVPQRSGFGGRGRGRGRGRGGAVAGPSSDPSTAAAQRRKEANKGSRANHNRRDQRARKMARGGFAG